MGIDEQWAIAILFVVCAALFAWAIVLKNDYRVAARRLMGLQFANPYGRLLGRVVEAKVYAGSKWERMVVVAVSWRGAVAVRPESDLATKARWIRKELVSERVREVS